MMIGKNIKELRKEKNITQEKLAEYLNVSCQAVSKWENETASPDISLIVPLANFFKVSTDELFGRYVEQNEREIEDIMATDTDLRAKGFVKKRIELWEKAIEKFPNNFTCLSNYASALFSAKWSAEFDNEQDVVDEYTEKSLKICERILEDCTETEHRDTATQLLVMIYGSGGRGHCNEEKAVRYAKQATCLYCSSEILLESAYEINTENHSRIVHNNRLTFLDLLCKSIMYVKYRNSEEKIFALNTVIKLYETVLYDKNYLFFNCRISNAYSEIALEYAKLQDHDKTLDNLYLAKKYAEEADAVPDGRRYYTSIFVCKAYHDNSTISKNYSCSEVDVLKEFLLKSNFDFMRNSKDFENFKNSL